MKLTVVRVRHVCGVNNIWSIDADVEATGAYWWGYINGVQLKTSINRCPYCGAPLPNNANED